MITRGKADYLELGDWNAVCFECGRKFKASQLKRHWRGYYVCAQHWEARHPQDFVRAVAKIQVPEFVQPMPADVFIEIINVTSVAGNAIAGHAIAGHD
jgi:hypothetical protein